jgi:hypothetical protein
VLALLSGLVLATRVDLDFNRLRIRLPVGTPPVDGRASLEVTALARPVGAPAALIVHVQAGRVPADIELLFDDAVVARARLDPRERTRIHGTVRPASRARHSVVILGTGRDWRVAEAEVASVFGHSRGLFSFNIVPAARSPDWPVSPWALLPMATALIIGRPRWEWPARPGVRQTHRLAVGVVALLLLAVLTSHWVGPYGVILGPQAWLLAVAVLYAERMATCGRALRRHTPGLQARPLSLLPHVTVAMLFLGAVGYFYDRAGGFTAFIMFGEGFTDRRHPAIQDMPLVQDPELGYDGQFYAHLAIDPLLLDEETVVALDAPGYRARRPVAPALAHVVGLGHPWYAVQTYAVLNVACWFVLGWLLLQWLPPGTAPSAAAWAACMLSGGLLASVARALVDGPSVVVLALAVLAVERGRHTSCAMGLGLAILSRDSHVVAGGLLASPERRWAWRSLAWHALLVVLPMALWLAYLAWMREIDPFDAGHRNFALPLIGLVGRWRQAFDEVNMTSVISLGVSGLTTMIGLTVQAMTLAARPRWRDAWWRVGAGYVVLLCLLGPSVWEGHPVAAARTLLPMTIAFNVLLVRYQWSWPLWFVGNLHVLEGLLLMTPWVGE